MKLSRRVALAGGNKTLLAVEHASEWLDVGDLPAHERSSLDWLAALPADAEDAAVGALPFQPRSFRDCLLFERHWIQSAHGYAKRFLPNAYRAARLVESVTHRTFPAFLPPRQLARQPTYYFGNHLTFVPSGTTVSAPSYTRALDYELELGLVLSKPLFNADPEQALQAIGGFVVVNDWTARDVQRPEMQSGFGPQKSKHFLSSMSQTLVTADEILPRIDRLDAYVEINGQRVASTSTRGMLFGLGAVLAHLSKSEHLYPGELIATGTLPDGCAMETGHWVAPGDTLRLVIESIGEIVHRIA